MTQVDASQSNAGARYRFRGYSCHLAAAPATRSVHGDENSTPPFFRRWNPWVTKGGPGGCPSPKLDRQKIAESVPCAETPPTSLLSPAPAGSATSSVSRSPAAKRQHLASVADEDLAHFRSELATRTSTVPRRSGFGEGHPLSHPFVERLIGTVRRECLDRTLFWTAADLEAKLRDFQRYYNGHRAHAGLNGRPPTPSADLGCGPANVRSYRWQSHCRGLHQTPIAA